MKKPLIAILLCLASVNVAWGHGNISKLPDSVQVLQYKMNLFMDPDDLETLNNLAMAQYRSGEIDDAFNSLQTVLKKDTNNFNAIDGMGVVLIRKGKYEEAMEYLQKAVAMNDKDVMVHVHLAVAYDKLNQPDKSKAELKKAGSLVTDSSEIELIDKELKIVSGY